SLSIGALVSQPLSGGKNPMSEPNMRSTMGGVRLEIEAGVAVVTIDRPDVRNAIGFATVDELGAALDDVLESSAAVLVLWGGAERLAQAGGRSRALLAVASGEVYDAAAAQRLGLLELVVPRSTFEQDWRTLAGRMAAGGPGTTRAVKSVIDAATPSSHPEL